MAHPTRREPFAKITTAAGTRYRLTPSDVLWTARAVVYEGGDPAATLWTLTQRYAGAAHREYDSFAAFVRAFSQPVNPRWRQDGEFCRSGGRYARSASCAEDRLERREQASAASFGELANRDPEALQTVFAWAYGRLPNPVPRAVNFADPAVSEAFLADRPGARIVLRHGNVYIAEAWSQPWPRSYVQVEGFDGARADADGVTAPGAFRAALATAYAAVLHPVRWV